MPNWRERRRGRLDHPRVAGQAEVVVAAQVDPLAPVVVERDRRGAPPVGHGVRSPRPARGVLAEQRGERVLQQRREGVPAAGDGADGHRHGELPSVGAGSPGCMRAQGVPLTCVIVNRRFAPIGSVRDRATHRCRPVARRRAARPGRRRRRRRRPPAVNTAVTCMADDEGLAGGLDEGGGGPGGVRVAAGLRPAGPPRGWPRSTGWPPRGPPAGSASTAAPRCAA